MVSDLGSERRIHETTSLCRECKDAIPATVVARPGGAVWMQKSCPTHGEQEVQLSDDAGWYERTRAIETRASPPRTIRKEIDHGCPFDCGACRSHAQKVRLPVVTITSACNLDCPICYVHNKNDSPFHMGMDEFRQILGHLKDDHDGDVDLVNFTGGEPTIHPHFLDFLEMAHEAGIHRVSICSNGIRLAKDEALVKRLGELKARIALSFDSFEIEADYKLQGAHLVDMKMRCMDLLEKYDVDTTLIPVMTKGVNDHEIGRIIRYAMGKRNVRHLEVHTITYTGQGGAHFDRSGRISMHEVLRRIESTTDGLLRPDDFVPSPCAHPLCYQIAYLLIDPEGGSPVPFTRFVSRETITECLADHLYIEPTRKLEEAMLDAIDRLWSEGGDDADRILRILKSAISQMFPPGRPISREEALRVSERVSKAIYIHSHMDEETFDNERIVQCCDSNCYADGTTIPVCAYNVLYRDKEEHFMLKPAAWGERRGGQRSFGPRLPVLRVHG
jgi:7,8-dihydro-6-hydroxymethylpterin dimethyltransferase